MAPSLCTFRGHIVNLNVNTSGLVASFMIAFSQCWMPKAELSLLLQTSPLVVSSGSELTLSHRRILTKWLCFPKKVIQKMLLNYKLVFHVLGVLYHFLCNSLSANESLSNHIPIYAVLLQEQFPVKRCYKVIKRSNRNSLRWICDFFGSFQINGLCCCSCREYKPYSTSNKSHIDFQDQILRC